MNVAQRGVIARLREHGCIMNRVVKPALSLSLDLLGILAIRERDECLETLVKFDGCHFLS